MEHEILDPSKARDATAAATATDRSEAAKTVATDRYDDLAGQVRALTSDIQTVQNGLLTNTEITKELRDRQTQMHEIQDQQGRVIQDVAASTAQIVDLFSASKSGVKFVQMFGAAVRKTVTWLLPIVVFGGTVWGILHGHWPTGRE